MERCDWCKGDALYEAYHDEEWGLPQHDDMRLFEFLILEGAQAGLSWITVLRKREHYRKVYDGFDPQKIARYTPAKLAKLLADPGIIRHRGKIEGTIAGAKAFLRIEAGEGFSTFLWRHVGGSPLVNTPRSLSDVAADTPESQALSRALKAEGFKFCGPTITYAFMQASGLVNDHLESCAFRG